MKSLSDAKNIYAVQLEQLAADSAELQLQVTIIFQPKHYWGEIRSFFFFRHSRAHLPRPPPRGLRPPSARSVRRWKCVLVEHPQRHSNQILWFFHFLPLIRAAKTPQTRHFARFCGVFAAPQLAAFLRHPLRNILTQKVTQKVTQMAKTKTQQNLTDVLPCLPCFTVYAWMVHVTSRAAVALKKYFLFRSLFSCFLTLSSHSLIFILDSSRVCLLYVQQSKEK